jgi:O-acetyl-ADP-ribose deacetylase (regulator of RNase III)
MNLRLFVFDTCHTIFRTLQNGMMNGSLFNQTICPLSQSNVRFLDRDPTAVVTLGRYIRLFAQTVPHLEEWKGNLSSLFIIEIKEEITRRSDVVRILNIATNQVEYLKNTYIAPTMFLKVFVISSDAQEWFKENCAQSYQQLIQVDPTLFPKNGRIEPILMNSERMSSNGPSSSIILTSGNLLNSSMQTLVNTINCVGVMGKGIALEFKNQYPAMFEDYRDRCRKGKVKVGVPYCYDLPGGKKIINFPTKNHWKDSSRLEWVEEGLKYLVEHLGEWGVQSIALPPLGCGNGHLDWSQVLPLIRRHLSPLNLKIEIYEPPQASSDSNARKRKADRSIVKS